MPVSTRAILEVRTPKDSLETPEAMVQFLAGLSHVLRTSWWKNFTRTQPTITLEIASLKQMVYFVVTVDKQFEQLIRSQITAHYPTALVTEMDDYLGPWSKHGYQAVGQMVLARPSYYPLKTYDKFATTDPVTALLGVLGKTPPNNAVIVQFVLAKAPGSWGNAGRAVIKRGVGSDPEKFEAHPQKTIIEEKLASNALWAGIRILGIGPTQEEAYTVASQTAGAFGTYAMAAGNALGYSRARNKTEFVRAMIERSFKFIPNGQYLNTIELASLFHFPGTTLSSLRNLAWGKSIKGEPPDNLPITEGLTEEEKRDITFVAKTDYRNRQVVYGIRKKDRRRHVYVLGKSGTGKSWLLANMAVSDMNNGMGFAVIDPHGDLVEEHILNYVPDYRINDVIYLDPSDDNNPFHLNPLEVKRPENKELVASGIVSIFQKIFYYSWGPRLEYILRNTIMTLVEVPGSTLLDIPPLLTNNKFREKVVQMIPEENIVLRAFWLKEYNEYPDKLRNEAIAPIMNKVGQFIGSPTIRSIISKPKSTLDLEDIMNSGKILLLNLSQGKLGEDNATLLGAMFITQFQQAAMNRAYIPEEDRKDFFLYVDEFQNFATTSFIKILSEARKYRLGLVLANQYTAQLPEEIQKAIFGNVGTMMSFVVGADDATRIMQEFGNLYTQEDLVNLDKFQIITKLSIENRISNPFPAYTLPLPSAHTANRAKVIELSKQFGLAHEGDTSSDQTLTVQWQKETQQSFANQKPNNNWNQRPNNGSGGQVQYNRPAPAPTTPSAPRPKPVNNLPPIRLDSLHQTDFGEKRGGDNRLLIDERPDMSVPVQPDSDSYAADPGEAQQYMMDDTERVPAQQKTA